jgi:hypothetical protein
VNRNRLDRARVVAVARLAHSTFGGMQAMAQVFVPSKSVERWAFMTREMKGTGFLIYLAQDRRLNAMYCAGYAPEIDETHIALRQALMACRLPGRRLCDPSSGVILYSSCLFS